MSEERVTDGAVQIGDGVRQLLDNPLDEHVLLVAMVENEAAFAACLEDCGGRLDRELGFGAKRIEVHTETVPRLLECDGVESVERVPDKQVTALAGN